MKTSFLIAIIIVVVAIFWILSGVVGGDSSVPFEQVEVQQSKTDDLIEVRVQNLSAQVMDDEVEVTGRTQASRHVILRAETEGQVASLHVRKGDIVKKGQVLARLEVRDRAAHLEEARQLLKQREIQFNASKELAEKGFNSRVRLAEKEAELQSARAGLKQAQEELSNIIIKAPFEGVVNDQMIEVGDYVSKGNESFEIVDLSPIEISGFLTEKQIGILSEGDTASAVLLDGRVVEGVITFMAAAADRETRTFKMEMTVLNDNLSIKEGLTVKILLPFREAKAYKISPSILSLTDDGVVGIKVVNDNNIVEFKPVRLLKDTPDYLWVGGLPDNIQVITVGQEFVISGQTIKPILSEGNNLL